MHRFKHLNATKGLLLSRALDLISVGRGLRDEWIVGSDRALELFCFLHVYGIRLTRLNSMRFPKWSEIPGLQLWYYEA